MKYQHICIFLSGHTEKFLFFNINMVTLTSSEDFSNNAIKARSTKIKLMADCLSKWYLSLLDSIFLLLFKNFIFTLLRTYMSIFLFSNEINAEYLRFFFSVGQSGVSK